MILPLIGLAMIAAGLGLLEVPGPVWLIALGYWIYTANDAQRKRP